MSAVKYFLNPSSLMGRHKELGAEGAGVGGREAPS